MKVDIIAAIINALQVKNIKLKHAGLVSRVYVIIEVSCFTLDLRKSFSVQTF